jgi:PPM family protein phosphatase
LDQVTIGVVCTTGIGPDRGGRSRNEDNYLVCRGGQIRYRKADAEEVRDSETFGVLLAIADGMGGHRDGDLASTAAVQAMSRLFKRGLPADPEEALREHVLTCHRRLRRKAAEHGPVRMGTTLTSAWVIGGQLAWTHVGDSRLYLCRDGELETLTRDHTRGEFARRDGRPVGNDQGFLAQNFIYGSRGIGDDAAIRVDPGLDSGSFPLLLGDRLLLCSDGLSAFVDEERILDVLRHRPEPQAAASMLMERASASGSDDNISVLIARIDHLDDTVLPWLDAEDADPVTLVPED